MKNLLSITFILVFLISCNTRTSNINASKADKQVLKIKHAQTAPLIDGIANESIWQNSAWHPIDKIWLGDSLNSEDFQGRYKLTWTKDALFLLAEIKDDILLDKESDPLTAWWDDDCLEIFIDEDNSGGNHQYTHNAFAYHVALDGNVVDMSPMKKGQLYNSHIESKRVTTKNTTIWEVKILVFDDNYSEVIVSTPVTLESNKKIGFALAYCDNDTSANREHFIGSVTVDGDDKNRGWIDADIFGTLVLIK